jgi:anaerobic selenocysteine-containing dehydrogenase
VWPYFYAGTMGYVMRDGINRLRHAKRYSNMYDTFCVALSWSGFLAGTGSVSGVDPREMQKSDLIVIWGGNPVNTQVNVMTHAMMARKNRGAKIACVDIYDTGTMKQADVKMLIRPGTDGALACAVMHVLFRDRYADWEYLEKYTDAPKEFEAHLKARTPEWASKICDVPAPTSRLSRGSSAQTPRSASSAWAMASRARATVPPTCMPSPHSGGDRRLAI